MGSVSSLSATLYVIVTRVKGGGREPPQKPGLIFPPWWYVHVHVIAEIGNCQSVYSVDKTLPTFAPCYSQSPPLADFTPPYGFLVRFLQQQLKAGGGGGLALYTLSLDLTLYYIKISFPHRSKCTERRRICQKTIPLLCFQKSKQNYLSKKKTHVCSRIAFCRKANRG